MTQEMKQGVKRELNRRLDAIRQELGQVEMTLRNLTHLGGDKDYAEAVTIGGLLDHTDWDGWTDFDEVVNDQLFQKAVRYQAAFNTLGF